MVPVSTIWINKNNCGNSRTHVTMHNNSCCSHGHETHYPIVKVFSTLCSDKLIDFNIGGVTKANPLGDDPLMDDILLCLPQTSLLATISR